MTNTPPDVSVAMCTYNGERFLVDQLRSLSLQQNPPAEVVVFDDASTDGSVQLIRKWAESAPFEVRLNVNGANVGFIRNFERAISECRSNLIALCDQDDVWEPEKLAVAADAFAQEPDLTAFFSDAQIIDDNGTRQPYSAWETVRFNGFEGPSYGQEVRRRLWNAHTVTGATLVFRSWLRDIVLPFPAALSQPGSFYIHDGWIAALAVAAGPVRAEPRPLIKYRLHASQSMGLMDPVLTTTNQSSRDRGASMLSELQRLTLLRERLNDITESRPIVVSCADEVEDRYLHLRARLEARHGQRGLVVIGKELVRGGYRRHSKGARSALLDLLRR